MYLPAGRRIKAELRDDDDEDEYDARWRTELAARFPRTGKRLLEIGPYDEQIAIYDGDCHVRGDLEHSAEHAFVIAVLGDLTIDGCLIDYQEAFTLVAGDLKARDIVTTAHLEVLGNTTVTGSLLGDYNDCAAYFHGDVTCNFFYPENHAFRIGGRLEARCAFGNAYLVEAASLPPFMNDARILEHLDRELVRVHDDSWIDEAGNREGPGLIIDGLASYGALKRRVFNGEPIGPRR